MKLSEKVKVNTRFCRSINISQDLDDADILSGFICPKSSELAILNMADNLALTGQAAFTWTGPYGAGKSSLALMLSALMGKSDKLRKMAKELLPDDVYEKICLDFSIKKGWEVLPVVGESKDIEELINKTIKEKGHDFKGDIFNTLKNIAKSNDGLIIFVDEMGKCLETAAKGKGDIYFFQQLAEFASRSKGKIVLVGILHQSFTEYAKHLPHTMRDEWSKIQGRFVDMPINTAGEEQIELISKAIKSDIKPSKVTNITKETVKIINNNSKVTSPKALESSLNACWPISPIVVCLLGQISRKRFGQNQRSIFSFLSSAEPMAFRDFVETRSYSTDIYYMPEDFFDYLRFNLESSIVASSDSRHWNMAMDAIYRSIARGADENHGKVIKTIALINIFKGTTGLVASRELLQCLYKDIDVNKVLEDLSSWSVIIFKEHSKAYAIYEGSDFDIEAAMKEAYLNVTTANIEKLSELANFKPIIAKRHYNEFGSMRWLDVVLAPVNGYEHFLNEEYKRGKSVGFFSVILPENADELIKAEKFITKSNKFDFPIIQTIAKNANIINAYAREILALEWIKKNKNELSGDSIARREIDDRKEIVTNLIETQLSEALISSEWYYKGKNIGILSNNELSAKASDICDKTFSLSPIIKSELLNRNRPSGSANSALNALLRRMVDFEGEERLGISGFPPEGGIFNILLQDTGIYIKGSDNNFHYETPKTKNLGHLWKATDEKLEGYNKSISLNDIYDFWSEAPFGVKAGLHNFLGLSYILTRRNKIALYREGNYVVNVDGLFVDYLMKSPDSISLKLVSVEDVSDHILVAIAGILNEFQKTRPLSKKSSSLEVARKLVSIVDSLPNWVLRTKLLSKQTRDFREIVKKAKDPNKLLFEDLEKVFVDDTKKHVDKSEAILSGLKEALLELTEIYPATMKNIALLLTNELDIAIPGPAQISRLNDRAKNIKDVSGNFRIEGFAARLSTFSSTIEDIIGIISLANSKPPQDWIDLDIDNAKKEILRMCTEFKKAELYTKVKNRPASRQAVAFITGIGGGSNIIEGEFDVLIDQKDEIASIKEEINSVIKKYSKKKKNLLLAALTEVSIEYLKGA